MRPRSDSSGVGNPGPQTGVGRSPEGGYPAPGAERSRSIALLRAATKSRTPSAPPRSQRSMRALPTTTPSATAATSAAWSGVEIPNPTTTGMPPTRRLTACTSNPNARRSWARAPVTPVSEM